MRHETWEKALIAANNITPGGANRKSAKSLGMTREDVRRGRAIWDLRNNRGGNRPLTQGDLAFQMRLKGPVGKIRNRYRKTGLAAINRNIDGCKVKLTLDLQKAVALLEVEGWAQYSKSYGRRWTRLAVLVVFDQDTRTRKALRVGPTVSSVEEALDYIKPAAVRKAETAGKRVLRQGDIYFVPSRKANFEALIGTRHQYEPQEGIVIHPEHSTLKLVGPHRAYRQMVVVGGKNRHGQVWGGRTSIGGD
jgi:hypothetical protein